MKGVLIYSDTCPKCRLLRALVDAFDLRHNIKFLSWRKASEGVLLEYYPSEEVPYNFMWIAKGALLYEGPAAIPHILKALFI
jgi:predicted DCC family thiol-disulfide oxidoreductase YuxK